MQHLALRIAAHVNVNLPIQRPRRHGRLRFPHSNLPQRRWCPLFCAWIAGNRPHLQPPAPKGAKAEGAKNRALPSVKTSGATCNINVCSFRSTVALTVIGTNFRQMSGTFPATNSRTTADSLSFSDEPRSSQAIKAPVFADCVRRGSDRSSARASRTGARKRIIGFIPCLVGKRTGRKSLRLRRRLMRRERSSCSPCLHSHIIRSNVSGNTVAGMAQHPGLPRTLLYGLPHFRHRTVQKSKPLSIVP